MNKEYFLQIVLVFKFYRFNDFNGNQIKKYLWKSVPEILYCIIRYSWEEWIKRFAWLNSQSMLHWVFVPADAFNEPGIYNTKGKHKEKKVIR